MNNGMFRQRKVYFTQVSTEALRDKNLSLKAKGLFALIQSYLTIPDFILYKTTLMNSCIEGQRAFEGAWKELKDSGYLIQYKIKNEKGQFIYEYELLDTPNLELANEAKKITKTNESTENTTNSPDIQNVGYGKCRPGKVGVYNNKYINNKYKYVCMYEQYLKPTKQVKEFLINECTNKIDIDLFEKVIVETVNNNKIGKKDQYIITILKELLTKNIKSVIEYEAHIEIYKSENKTKYSKTTKATKKNKTENKSDNTSKKLKTKFHNFSGSENFKKYSPEELEMRLLESQKGKFHTW